MKKIQLTTLIVALSFFFIGWLSNSFLSSTNFLKIQKTTTLEKIKKRKHLDVVIMNSPTVYFIGLDKPQGFEYELLLAYANSIDVDLNLSVVYSVKEALELSRKGVGDLTAAAISMTPQREKEFEFGPSYYRVQEQLICNSKLYRKGLFPKDFEDLKDLKIMVGKDTSYVATLKKLKEEVKDLEYDVTDKYSTEQLLELVYKKQIDCTVADSNIFMINQRYYPDLSRAMVLGESKNLAWIVRDKDGSLKDSLFTWLNEYERSGKMAELRDFYYSFLTLFDYYDTKVFSKRLKNRFPKYKKYFKEAGKKYGVPWQLLAAVSYQESHWNPKAKSHTGVRGMMMLTKATAKYLGIKNRLDAKQSIMGGAKYLKETEARFPKEIKGKTRWAFTLAAYNVGMGHIHDAQTLARKMNRNPYSWSDIKEVLPLLSHAKYYKKLKYGYARGIEPVNYVASIQNYLTIMRKH